MRIIETKVYTFDELSEQGKQNAIETMRQRYYEHNDFGRWAIDDCALLEPVHNELAELLGDEYDFPLIKNTRESIYFDTDRNSFLDCAKAIEITNEKHFLKWLGVDGIEGLEYSIYTPNGRNSNTNIEFENYGSEFDDVIESAVEKFNTHIKDVLKRLEADIEYRFTDEAIEEDIEANNDEFTEDGKLV